MIKGVILNSSGGLANYFPVNNALYLRQQVAKAFSAIQSQAGSSGSIAVVGASVSSTSFAVIPSYSSTHDGKDWTGEMTAYRIDANGMIGDVLWLASAGVPSGTSAIAKRVIYTALSHVDDTNRASVVLIVLSLKKWWRVVAVMLPLMLRRSFQCRRIYTTWWY